VDGIDRHHEDARGPRDRTRRIVQQPAHVERGEDRGHGVRHGQERRRRLAPAIDEREVDDERLHRDQAEPCHPVVNQGCARLGRVGGERGAHGVHGRRQAGDGGDAEVALRRSPHEGEGEQERREQLDRDRRGENRGEEIHRPESLRAV